MAKQKNQMWVYLAIALIVVGAIFGGARLLSVADNTGDTQVSIISSSEKAEFCANNPALDAKLRVRDVLSSTKAYLNATVLIKNMDTGSIVEKDVTSSSGDFVTFADLFECKNEKGYEIYVKGESPSNSDGIVVVSPEDLVSTPIEKTIETSVFGAFKVKAYDNVERAKVEEVTTNSTDYTTDTTASFDGLSGASASPLDVTFTMRPVTNAYAFGKQMYIIIDSEDESNLADYDENTFVVKYNGVELKEATGLSENELRAMNSYEKIYALPQSIGIGADGSKVTESTLQIAVSPEADELSYDYDLIVKVIARGDVESVESDTILTGVGFKDDSSRTPLYTAQTMTLVIA